MSGSKRRVGLALQGAGAHGAFTWGVLDGLLAQDDLEVVAISGASSGALTGAVMCSAWAEAVQAGHDPKQAARQGMDRLWTDIGRLSNWSGLQASWLDKWIGGGNMQFSPAFHMIDWAMRLGHPGQFNPFDINPMSQLIGQNVNFKVLTQDSGSDVPDIFVNITHVRTGQSCVFAKQDLTNEIIRASGCIPFLQNPVYINNEAYWDGGYSENPSLKPFWDMTLDEIYIIIPLPEEKKDLPVSPSEMMDRLTEISMQSVCQSQIDALKAYLDYQGRQMHIKIIRPGVEMARLDFSSKLNTDIDFLVKLKKHGITALNKSNDH